MSVAADKPYRVLVDDNFAYMDEDARYEYGAFATLDEAVAACQAIVEASLQRGYRPGMSATALYEGYVAAGRTPLLSGPAPSSPLGPTRGNVARPLCGGRVAPKDT